MMATDDGAMCDDGATTSDDGAIEMMMRAMCAVTGATMVMTTVMVPVRRGDGR